MTPRSSLVNLFGAKSFLSADPMVTSGRTRILACLKGSESGSGLVEYAIVFIVLITMLLAIADFSRALYAYHFVSNAAREGARYAMVRGCNPTSTQCPTPATTNSVQTYLQNAPMGIDSTQVSATTSWPVEPTSPTICSTAATNNSAGCTVQVTVTYPFNFLFPFVSTSTLNMTSTSQMIISQ